MATILIVDDIDYVRKSIRSILQAKGYTILEASDGNEAIELIRKNKIDLLITDVVMPKKGGIEALLEHRDELAQTKKIIITGEVTKQSTAFVTLASTLGVKKVLYKPFEKEELVSAVEELIGNVKS
jgi:YesN/AraC family two-component response regulator